MALHIRDIRQSDKAELSKLCETGRLTGPLPPDAAGARIFAGIRKDRLVAAIWLTLDGDIGRILAIVTSPAANGLSDTRELIAEASLWLTSRGATSIELSLIPEQGDVLAALLDLDFHVEEQAGALHRLVQARSAA
jgi:hypothetical protein